jgi:hypothetical protein
MSLFDDIERPDVGPRLYAEPEFTYLNRSGRPAVQRIRDLMDQWYLHYPLEHRPDLRGRFRSTDNANHRSAFYELFLHELLRRLGCRVQIHPPIAGIERHPDFLVESETHHARFYLEAVVVTEESEEEMAAQSRMNTVYDAINRLDSPDFYVGMSVFGSPATPPPARRIRDFITEHFGQTTHDEIAGVFAAGGLEALPRWQYEHDGWVIQFFPIPKPPERRGRPGVRPIGIQFTGFQTVETRESIRTAVVEKAHLYGQLDLPYIIALNALGDFVDRSVTLEALLGAEQISFARDPQRTEIGRAQNGAWTSPAGPRYTRVSGVLVTTHLSPSSIQWASICLYHNPWAALPYDCELNRLHNAVPVTQTTLEFRRGESLASILSLPPDWPGE